MRLSVRVAGWEVLAVDLGAGEAQAASQGERPVIESTAGGQFEIGFGFEGLTARDAFASRGKREWPGR